MGGMGRVDSRCEMARTGAEGGQGDRRVQGVGAGRGGVEGVEGVSACLQAVQGGDRGRGLLLRAEWLGQRGRSLRGPLLQRGFAVSLASCGLPDAHTEICWGPLALGGEGVRKPPGRRGRTLCHSGAKRCPLATAPGWTVGSRVM